MRILVVLLLDISFLFRARFNEQSLVHSRYRCKRNPSTCKLFKTHAYISLPNQNVFIKSFMLTDTCDFCRERLNLFYWLRSQLMLKMKSGAWSLSVLQKWVFAFEIRNSFPLMWCFNTEKETEKLCHRTDLIFFRENHAVDLCITVGYTKFRNNCWLIPKEL